MKLNQSIDSHRTAGGGNALRKVCIGSCKEILAQIKKTRAAILSEARDTLKVQDRMLRLALNEAEALASQTLYPHLFFPALAAEKVRGVAAWHKHQRAVGGQAQ